MTFGSELRDDVCSADVEVWPSQAEGLDAGPVGYAGESGWWISKAFEIKLKNYSNLNKSYYFLIKSY